MATIQVRISRPLREPTWRKRSNSLELNQDRFESPSEPLTVADLNGEWTMRCRHQSLPFRDGSIDRIVIEEVLELVRDDHSLFREIARVVKPGGTVRTRVPNAGPLAGLDSLNLYRYVADVIHRGVTIPEVREVGFRRHFTLDAIEAALGPNFEVERAWTTGTALSELANFAVLAAATLIWHAPDCYLAVRPPLQRSMRFDRAVPAGAIGYWRWVEAKRTR